MTYPQQTFASIQALVNYINAYVIENGHNAITGVEANNILNALAGFIQSYTLNNGLVKIDSTTGSVVVLSRPMTVLTGAPTSVQWPGNAQNEYYITNATSNAIPITASFSFTDQFGTAQQSIPARTSIHIAKADNGSWIQQNNLPGSGSGGGLPPQAGNIGKALFADGNTGLWQDPIIFVDQTSFEPDGVTCLLNIPPNYHFMIFFDTLAGWIYEQDGQWQYVNNPGDSPPQFGFKLLIGGVNANTQPVRLHIFLIGQNSN